MPRTHFQVVTALPAPSAYFRFQERTRILRVGVMLLLLLAATAATLSAQTFKTLHSFCSKTNPAGSCLDGGFPTSALVQGTNGVLYGTTNNGGTNVYGTVFKINTGGTLTTIYNFCSQASCTDGANPQGGLVLASNGSFYGVARVGGAYGYGTVFKITGAGKLTTLHSFNDTDGSYPQAALTQAANGNFYGTTAFGGVYNNGSAFEITPSGTFTSLYSFCPSGVCTDGSELTSGLIQAADGNFYGTAYGGGSSCSPNSGSGSFFQLTSSGTLTTLGGFCQPNGFSPNSSLVQGANGDFYGTTAAGGDGTNTGFGTVYEMTSTGSLTTLYSFCLQTTCVDGNIPLAILMGTDGNFYGTTENGGANNGVGTVFDITPTGQLTTLHTFTGTDGSNPRAGLLLDTNGTFYGTTSQGGQYSKGVVFSLATGIGPFVETIPTAGKVGTKVIILGSNLKGATAVSFNGTAAIFKVVSASEITTTVPAGATNGTVTVATLGGTTLNSNVAFRVQ